MIPKVSVIVPAYKVEEYIANCIESLINQTLKDIQIIIINDGSPDRSLKIANDYATRDQRILVINQNNRGLSEARNVGINHALGEYITFVDPDDWIESNMLEEMYKMAKSYNDIDVVSSGITIDYKKEGKSVVKKPTSKQVSADLNKIGDLIFDLCKHDLYNLSCTKLFRTSFLKENKLYFEKNAMPAEDILFNTEVYLKLKSIAVLDKSYYHYIKEDRESLVTQFYIHLPVISQQRLEAFEKIFNYYNLNNQIHSDWLKNAYINEKFDSFINIYRNNCPLNIKQKINYIDKYILNDKKLISSFGECSIQLIYLKLFKWIYPLNNALITYFLYSFLFFLKRRLSFLYRLYRKKIIN